MYTSWHLAEGTGADKYLDPSPFSVDDSGEGGDDSDRSTARIYLEYCDKGNMKEYIQDLGKKPSEQLVWKIWECLILGLSKISQEILLARQVSSLKLRSRVQRFTNCLAPFSGQPPRK